MKNVNAIWKIGKQEAEIRNAIAALEKKAMKSIEEHIRFLNQIGFEIIDEREGGLGFIVRKSLHSEYGTNLGYSHRRGFYVSVGSRERDTTEIKNLAAALNNLADVAESLNECLQAELQTL